MEIYISSQTMIYIIIFLYWVGSVYHVSRLYETSIESGKPMTAMAVYFVAFFWLPTVLVILVLGVVGGILAGLRSDA